MDVIAVPAAEESMWAFFPLSPTPPSLKASYFLFQPPFYINYLSNLHI